MLPDYKRFFQQLNGHLKKLIMHNSQKIKDNSKNFAQELINKTGKYLEIFNILIKYMYFIKTILNISFLINFTANMFLNCMYLQSL